MTLQDSHQRGRLGTFVAELPYAHTTIRTGRDDARAVRRKAGAAHVGFLMAVQQPSHLLLGPMPKTRQPLGRGCQDMLTIRCELRGIKATLSAQQGRHGHVLAHTPHGGDSVICGSHQVPAILGQVGIHHRITGILLGIFSLGWRQGRKGTVAATFSARSQAPKLCSAIIGTCHQGISVLAFSFATFPNICLGAFQPSPWHG
mmetsp:Transcript_75313/g.166397  ORF Transcript_75313/g.166397 Transcript_75313/m.166397 type:complete len:202 (-) Transcript_75313:22-627(-)